MVAATNRDLDQAIRAGEFREDLYHRLRVVRIEMPPLRDRGDDLVALAGHFLGMYASRFGLEVDCQACGFCRTQPDIEDELTQRIKRHIAEGKSVDEIAAMVPFRPFEEPFGCRLADPNYWGPAEAR